MPKTIRVATVQMDATPAPLTERLERAETLVFEAAQSEAQLVVLPELFNIGYAYTDRNFESAEPINGKTNAWMKAASARLNIHLAGTFLLLEDGEIYNSMLLFSPSGEMWRYDKNYPWAWERGYFRERRGITVAETELGDLGFAGHGALLQVLLAQQGQLGDEPVQLLAVLVDEPGRVGLRDLQLGIGSVHFSPNASFSARSSVS